MPSGHWDMDLLYVSDRLYPRAYRSSSWHLSFATIICGIVLAKFPCAHIILEQEHIHTTDKIRLPRFNYLPDSAGRWNGILINWIEKAVLRVIAIEFEQLRDQFTLKVILHSMPVTCSLNSQ